MNLRAIRRLIAKGHGLRQADVQVRWTQRPRTLEYRDGNGTYQTAKVLVTAPGFSSREMIVQEDEDSLMTR